jgi:hypothetical protein
MANHLIHPTHYAQARYRSCHAACPAHVRCDHEGRQPVHQPGDELLRRPLVAVRCALSPAPWPAVDRPRPACRTAHVRGDPACRRRAVPQPGAGLLRRPPVRRAQKPNLASRHRVSAAIAAHSRGRHKANAAARGHRVSEAIARDHSRGRHKAIAAARDHHRRNGHRVSEAIAARSRGRHATAAARDHHRRSGGHRVKEAIAAACCSAMRRLLRGRGALGRTHEKVLQPRVLHALHRRVADLLCEPRAGSDLPWMPPSVVVGRLGR